MLQWPVIASRQILQRLQLSDCRSRTIDPSSSNLDPTLGVVDEACHMTTMQVRGAAAKKLSLENPYSLGLLDTMRAEL